MPMEKVISTRTRSLSQAIITPLTISRGRIDKGREKDSINKEEKGRDRETGRGIDKGRGSEIEKEMIDTLLLLSRGIIGIILIKETIEITGETTKELTLEKTETTEIIEMLEIIEMVIGTTETPIHDQIGADNIMVTTERLDTIDTETTTLS